jgi:hypothetical protein
VKDETHCLSGEFSDDDKYISLAVIQKILKGEIGEEGRRVKRETKLVCCLHGSSLLPSLKIRQDFLLSCSTGIGQAELAQCTRLPAHPGSSMKYWLKQYNQIQKKSHDT